MDMVNPRIVLAFASDDAAWLKRNRITVPDFWAGHGAAPMTGDVVRLGGRQFTIQGRVWENDAEGPLLRVFLGEAHAHSDTVFG